MARKYDATRRKEAATRTREAILDAAFKLHGLGVIDYESLAEEANVSIPTIRKHFPTREALFEGCTSWGMRYAAVPDIELLRSTATAETRTALAVQQTYAFYDSVLGQIWVTYKHQDESPVLARALTELEEMIREIVDLVMAAWGDALPGDGEQRGLVAGLLSFLTYFALHDDGGLSRDQATARISEALLNSLRVLSRQAGRRP